MPQSSALRREATNPTPITINSQDVPNPKDAKITNDGSVTFNAAQACWLYFLPVGVLGDAHGILKLVQGNNGRFDPGQQNVTVSYCITDPNTTRTPTAVSASSTSSVGLPEAAGSTIKVG